jgi:integrase/recombinase XerD
MSHHSVIDNNGIALYLKHFLEWSKAMNYSADTVKTRETCVRRFIIWCEARGLDKPQDITQPILERYRRYLFNYRKSNGAPLSHSTQHSHLAPIKAFFKWLNKHNYILYNPASEFELPRVPKRLPKNILTIEEINDMLNHTAVYGDIGIRDRAIIETFYSTGIRRMKLVNLKIHDIDLDRGTLVIFDGKGQRDRIVPIGARACVWVRKYMEDIRPELVRDDDTGHLFLTEYGEPFIRNRITDLIKKYKKAVGIDKKGASHLFRYAMATHMLDNGADIRYIQMILGHKNLTSTEIYTQVSIKKLQQVHAATHPARLER